MVENMTKCSLLIVLLLIATGVYTVNSSKVDGTALWSTLVLEEAEQLLLFHDLQNETPAAEESEEAKSLRLSLKPFSLDVQSATEACVYDSLALQWHIHHDFRHEDDFYQAALAVKSLINPGHVSIAPLSSIFHRDLSIDEEGLQIRPVRAVQQSGQILCESEDVFCKVHTAGINLISEERKMIVHFDQATNQPVFETLEELQKALLITPPLTQPCQTSWQTPQQLMLTLDQVDIERILTAYYAQEKVQILLPMTNTSSLVGLRDQHTFRLLEHGDVEVFVINQKTKRALSPMKQVTVKHCDGSLPMPSSHISSRFRQPHLQKPVFHLKGLFAVTGNDAIKLSNEAVPSLEKGSWSLSFWIKLLELPTGAHRALFYKSDPQDANLRTPSAWLLPASNHLTVRLSTEENVDSGFTTNAEIAMNSWTHLSFVFRNSSYSPEQSLHEAWNQDKETKTLSDQGIKILNKSPSLHHKHGDKAKSTETNQGYKISVYINGKLDIEAEFLKSVIPNSGSLLLFKDSTFLGPKSFAKDIMIHQVELDKVDIMALYHQGVSGEDTLALDQTLELLQNAENKLLPYQAVCDDTNNAVKKFFTRNYCQELRQTTSNTDLTTISNTPIDGSDSIITVHEASLIPPSIVEMIVKKSQQSIQNCEDYEARLAMHLESAEVGSVDGVYNWARLLMYGYEIPDSKCGFIASKSINRRKKSTSPNLAESRVSSDGSAKMSIDEIEHVSLFADMARAVYGFTVSVDHGVSDALVPLAMSLYAGVGLDSLVHYNRSLDEDWEIPTSLYSGGTQRRKDKLRLQIGQYLAKSIEGCRHSHKTPKVDGNKQLFPYSVLCDRYYQHPLDNSHASNISAQVDFDPSKLALGLLFVASMHGNVDAQVALAYKYEHGIGGVQKDLETATHYLVRPVQVASDVFHAVGAQPVVEADRINDYTAADIGKGHQGNDDEIIQYQIVRAKEGDVPAMLAMGDLYYYGARGLPRDQQQALRYYEQAANVGDTSGMCGVANMYLKGEGTEKNISHAIELYEFAAKNGSIRAYNGLGYIYFYGIPGEIEKNDTLAFQYFLLAAEFESDGDACFNAAFCLEQGIGVKANLTRAIHYYTIAAKKGGHFDSVKTLGMMTMEGRGVPRSAENAMVYLNAAKSIGPWMGWLRRGFDLFLTGTTSNDASVFMRSLFCYIYSGELGYEVAQSNAGYILRSKLIPQLNLPAPVLSQAVVPIANVESSKSYSSSLMMQRLLLREYSLGAYIHGYIDSFFYLGNCYFTGRCGLLYRDAHMAKHYYLGASMAKHGLASAYLGVMYHFNVGLQVATVDTTTVDSTAADDSRRQLLRALQHYDDALATPLVHDSLQLRTIVTVLKQMCSWKLSSATSSSSYYTALLKPLDYSLDYVVKMLWNM